MSLVLEQALDIKQKVKAQLRPHYHSAKLLLWRRRYHNYLKSRLGPYVKDVDFGPPPSKDLVLKTVMLDEDGFEKAYLPNSCFLEMYYSFGYRTFLNWFKDLEKHGFNLRTVGGILELGCGNGRLLRHLRCIDGIRLVGCDTNPECIEWSQMHLPGPDYFINQLEPPLEFAEDAAFDFVYAYSVFTHIPLDRQRPWLEEIRRVLKPGGFFVCTTIGQGLIEYLLPDKQRAEFKATGHFTYDADNPRASLATRAGGSNWDIFQSRYEVIKSYGSVMKMLDYQPGSHQDVLILQKPG